MLSSKAALETVPFPEGVVRAFLESIFVNARESATAEHLRAAETAVQKGLTVISGGPGTGKTSVVARILVLLQALSMANGETRRILLLAPTGKAAARLGQAMRAKLAEIEAPASVKAEIPQQASTIHRILAVKRGASGPANLRRGSVPADITVIDEASMVDLSLLHRLLQALPEKSRLILLGDRDQLASVEAGSIFSDICDAGTADAGGEGAEKPPLQEVVVRLRQSFRFSGTSGIARLAESVKNGEAEKVVELLASSRSADLSFVEPRAGKDRRALEELILHGYLPVFSAFDPGEALNRMERFRMLCAHRHGPDSAGDLNELAEYLLHREGLIASGEEGGWYRGRPLLITRNCYPLGLYNGDTGILWPDAEKGGDLRAFFYGAEPGTLRSIAPARLPQHDTAYAMTIHKSQGSEFDEVVVVLPGEISPVLSRELLYTALTRARTRVTLYGAREIIGQTVLRKVDRASGLVDLLRKRQF
jgi:exodeoxyribonuclease V alpha subunit